jgi:type I restriction-modification system DNA methylase subunit
MNLYLHGAKDVQVKQGDTLRNPLFLEKGKLKTFDCVLANPPFGMEKWGHSSLSPICLAETYGDAPRIQVLILRGYSIW